MNTEKRWSAEEIYKQLSRVRKDLADKSKKINKNLGTLKGIVHQNAILSRKYSNQDKYRMKLEENLKERLNEK